MRTNDSRIRLNVKEGTYTRTYVSKTGKSHERTYQLIPGKKLVAGKVVPRTHGDKKAYFKTVRSRNHRLATEKIQQNRPKMNALMSVLAQKYQVSETDIFIRNRMEPISTARKVGMYLGCVCFNWTWSDCATMFLRDRNTVKSACAYIEDKRDEPIFDAIIDDAEQRIAALVPGASVSSRKEIIDAEHVAKVELGYGRERRDSWVGGPEGNLLLPVGSLA